MSRRDTIIIAVLINAGLLLILFATALPSKEDSETSKGTDSSLSQLAVKEGSLVEPAAQKEQLLPSIQPADEVDMVLSEWNIKPGERLEASNNGLTYQSASSQGGDDVKENSSLVAISADSKPTTNNEPVLVTVKKGDSLDRIARAYGTTVQEITSLNQLESGVLQIGQVLKVPAKKGEALATPSSKGSSSSPSAPKEQKKVTNAKQKNQASAKAGTSQSTSQGPVKYYTVKSGDNPWLIANKNNVKLEDLLRLNNLNEEKARKLKPGDKIRIK